LRAAASARIASAASSSAIKNLTKQIEKKQKRWRAKMQNQKMVYKFINQMLGVAKAAAAAAPRAHAMLQECGGIVACIFSQLRTIVQNAILRDGFINSDRH